MNGVLTRLDTKPSNYGGYFTHAYFMCEDGKSYRTCLSPKCRNFKNWESIIKAGPGTKLTGLEILKKDIITADSPVKIVGEPEQMGLEL